MDNFRGAYCTELHRRQGGPHGLCGATHFKTQYERRIYREAGIIVQIWGSKEALVCINLVGHLILHGSTSIKCQMCTVKLTLIPCLCVEVDLVRGCDKMKFTVTIAKFS